MFWNNYPYTNFHELNLDWILCRVREAMAKSDKALKTAEEALNYAKAYFDSPEFDKKVDELLQNILTDEKLREIINQQIFGELNTKVDDLKNYVDTIPAPTLPEEIEDYKKSVLDCLASYLAVNNFSSCLTAGAVNDGAPVVLEYANRKGYLGIFGAGRFVYTDSINVSGTNYKKLYMDCATFTGLILKGINYHNSPYYLAFNGAPTEAELVAAAQESGGFEKPYTLDCFNNFNPDQMAYVLDKSGCVVKPLSKTVANGTAAGAYTPYIDTRDAMQTGDLVWWATSTRAEAENPEYKGIYHCAVFVKTLAELNEFANNYGVQITPILDSVDDQRWGYVVDMNTSETTTPYINCLCVRTLYHHMHRPIGSHNWVGTFTCRPRSNFMNSNKARKNCLGQNELVNKVNYGTILDGRTALIMDMLRGDLTASGTLTAKSSAISGINLAENSDLNDLRNGHWCCDSAAALSTIKNAPVNTMFFDVVGFGFFGNATGVQMFVGVGGSQTDFVVYVRTTTGTGVWKPWRQVMFE